MLCHLTLIPHLAEKMILHKNYLSNLGENLRSNLVQAAKILYNIGMKLHLFWWLWVPYNSCRTTRSCIIGPYHQGCGPDSIEKDSRSARRADRSCQRQVRLHTVGFGLAEGQPTCGVGRRPSLRSLYPSHES